MLIKKLFIFVLLFSFAFFLSSTVCADGGGCTDDSCALSNPLGDTVSTPQAFIGKVINAVLGVVGSLALVMFIYGGFTWMLAAGNSEAVQKGKNILIWATIGLVIIFSSYALVKFVIGGIGA